MTYNVFVGTLSLNQSINQSIVAVVVVSHVERGSQSHMTWSDGGKAPVDVIPAVCAWNHARPDVGRPQPVTTAVVYRVDSKNYRGAKN